MNFFYFIAPIIRNIFRCSLDSLEIWVRGGKHHIYFFTLQAFSCIRDKSSYASLNKQLPFHFDNDAGADITCFHFFDVFDNHMMRCLYWVKYTSVLELMHHRK